MPKREGSLIYSLMHHGWWQGKEQFRNRWSCHFEFDRTVTDAEKEQVITAAMDGLTSLDGAGPKE